jgi:hypothetical protein
MSTTPLPEWADRWGRSRCSYGSRLVVVSSYDGERLVCSTSGWAPEKCDDKEN